VRASLAPRARPAGPYDCKPPAQSLNPANTAKQEPDSAIRRAGGGLLASETSLWGIPASTAIGRPTGPWSPTCWAAGCEGSQRLPTSWPANSLIPNRWPGGKPWCANGGNCSGLQLEARVSARQPALVILNRVYWGWAGLRRAARSFLKSLRKPQLESRPRGPAAFPQPATIPASNPQPGSTRNGVVAEKAEYLAHQRRTVPSQARPAGSARGQASGPPQADRRPSKYRQVRAELEDLLEPDVAAEATSWSNPSRPLQQCGKTVAARQGSTPAPGRRRRRGVWCSIRQRGGCCGERGGREPACSQFNRASNGSRQPVAPSNCSPTGRHCRTGRRPAAHSLRCPTWAGQRPHSLPGKPKPAPSLRGSNNTRGLNAWPSSGLEKVKQMAEDLGIRTPRLEAFPAGPRQSDVA